MDTVLNLGLNDKTVEALAKKSGDRRFAFDSYRRFVQMYSDVVLGIEINHFEKHLERAKEKRGVKQDICRKILCTYDICTFAVFIKCPALFEASASLLDLLFLCWF